MNDLENAQAPVGGRPTVKHEARQSRGSFVRPKDDVSTSPTSKDNVTTTATAGRESGTVYKKADLPGLSLSASVVKEEVDTAVKEELGIVDDVSPDEEDTGPDFDFKNQHVSHFIQHSLRSISISPHSFTDKRYSPRICHPF